MKPRSRSGRRKKPRWGHLHEIRHVKKVPSKEFFALPRRLKHLAAWRRMHMTPGKHGRVRAYGTAHGVRPSSNLRLKGKPGKLHFISRFLG